MKIIKLVNNASVHCLVKRWGERYVPDLSVLSCPEASQLIGVACLEGRAKTVAKLQRVMQLNCECAGIKTDVLFSYIPNVVNLSESQRLAHYVWQVYEKVLELYKQQSPSPVTLATVSSRFAGTTDFSSDFLTKWAMPMLEMPDIEQLAMVTAPVLQQLQAQHRLTSDSRAIGFISTQFHFSTELIFKRLTHLEQVLLSPYFKFAEEQVCIPLQRVCQAAAQHPPDSPSLAIVQHLLPLSQEIASSVYR
ncbi:MAG: hypothetical protein LDL41_16585, partial [Coleofasciculus sp. S288]|nr:hypothetical protein [Coleofasciculus sp. S288]